MGIAEATDINSHCVLDLADNTGRLSMIPMEDSSKFALGGTLKLNAGQTLEDVQDRMTAEAVSQIVRHVVQQVSNDLGVDLREVFAVSTTKIIVGHPAIESREHGCESNYGEIEQLIEQPQHERQSTNNVLHQSARTQGGSRQPVSKLRESALDYGEAAKKSVQDLWSEPSPPSVEQAGLVAPQGKATGCGVDSIELAPEVEMQPDRALWCAVFGPSFCGR